MFAADMERKALKGIYVRKAAHCVVCSSGLAP